MLEEEPVTENNTNTMSGLPPCSSMKELSLGTEEEGEAEAAKQNKEEREVVTNSPTSHINGTAHHQKEEPQQNYQMSHNYQEYNVEEDIDRDQYTPQYYGFRER